MVWIIIISFTIGFLVSRAMFKLTDPKEEGFVYVVNNDKNKEIFVSISDTALKDNGPDKIIVNINHVDKMPINKGVYDNA